MDQILDESTVSRGTDQFDVSLGGEPFVSPSTKPEQFQITQLSVGLGFYSQYLIDSDYTTTTGYDVLACGQTGTDNVVVRTSSPVTEKWVYWTVERVNAKPLIPALTTSDPNEVPIEQKILFCNVLPLVGGSELWRVSGVNHYKLIRAKTAQSKYPIGSTPAEVATAATRYYEPADFATSIIDASVGAVGLTFQTVIQQEQ